MLLLFRGLEQGDGLLDAEAGQRRWVAGAAVADEIVASVASHEGERRRAAMGAALDAARDVDGVAARCRDGGCKPARIGAGIDTRALAGRRADTSKDVETRVGGVGNEAECADVTRKGALRSSGNAGKEQRAPGRGS